MNSRIYITILLFMPILITACRNVPEIDRDAEKAEVAQVVHDSIEWALDKNLQKLYNTMLQDSSLFFYQPSVNTDLRGFDQLKRTAEQFWMTDRFEAVRTDITELQVTLSRSGTTAWFRCMLDDVALIDGQEAGWLNTRWTGVLDKVDGKWLIHQMHFSFAAEQ